MGFWNKIKQGISTLTGNAGSMQMNVDRTEVRRGESINVSFTLTASSDFTARSIGVELNGTETIKYKVDVPVAAPANPAAGTTTTPTTTSTNTEERTATAQTYHNQQIVDGTPFTLQQGTSRQYNATVQVPTSVQPTYKGTAAAHVWTVRVYADVAMGGDPAAETEIIVL